MFLLPIIDTIIELIQVLMEIPKGILSKKVIQLNSEIESLQHTEQEQDTNCIGFQYNSNEFEEDE